MTKEAKARAYAKELYELTNNINALKKRQDELKAWFRVETEETPTDYGTWFIDFTDRRTPTVDAKRLQLEQPDIFAEYGKITESKVIKVKARK